MEKPIVLVIMDGVGKGDGGSGDAVVVAKTPVLDNLLATCPHTPNCTIAQAIHEQLTIDN